MRLRAVLLTMLLPLTGAAGCASSGAVPQPFPSPRSPSSTAPIVKPAAEPIMKPIIDPVAEPRSAGRGADLVSAALDLRGIPYRSGGQDPQGFDCSGLVWYVFARNGISVPRTVATQFVTGRAVEAHELQPGDLVFFQTGVSRASHVGLAIGGDEFVHAPSSRGEVRVEHLASPYWARHFVGARRLL